MGLLFVAVWMEETFEKRLKETVEGVSVINKEKEKRSIVN